MGRPDLQHVGGIAKSDQPVLDASSPGPAESEGARFNRIRDALFHGELRVGALLYVAFRANISLRSARPSVTPRLIASWRRGKTSEIKSGVMARCLRVFVEGKGLRQRPERLPIPFSRGAVVPKVVSGDCFDANFNDASDDVLVRVRVPADNKS